MYMYIYTYIHIYITRLSTNEIFSTSNKIRLEVGRAKDLPALPVHRGDGNKPHRSTLPNSLLANKAFLPPA